MSQAIFNAEEEIDKLVDKYSEELKLRMKKVLARHTRVVMKECMVSGSTSSSKKPVASSTNSGRRYDDRDRYDNSGKRRDYRRHDSSDDSD